jgi:hypothetical protein
VSCKPANVLRPLNDDKMAGIGGVDDEMTEQCESKEDEKAELKEGEEVELSSEDEAGERRTKKLLDPRKPNQEAIDEHERTHLPYRNWCRHCVKGRGKEAPHRKTTDKPEMPEFHVDFGFFGDEGSPGKTVPVLVVRERLTKMMMAAAVPSKSTGTYIARRVAAFIEEVGCGQLDITVKSDQEAAIVSIVEEVGRVRSATSQGRYVIEHSPVGSSSSNGIVERGIQSVEQQVRVLKSSLEDRWKIHIPARHSVVAWLAEYSAFLLNRFEVGRDGKTAYERCKGKQARTAGLEFGEAVLWKRKRVGGALGKMTCLWREGVFVGVRGQSGEIMVSTKDGIFKTRTVQRRPQEERWSAASAAEVVWVPWWLNQADPKCDGEKLETVQLSEKTVVEERAEAERIVPTRFAISKDDLLKHGYSAKCPGCKAILRGTARQGHSEECRKRMAREMSEVEKVVTSKSRREEFMKKCMDEDAENQKKRKLQEATSSSGVSGEGGASSSGLKRDEKEEAGGDARKIKMEEVRGDKRELEETTMTDADERPKKVTVNNLEVNQEQDDAYEDHYDEKTGVKLDGAKVREARCEEIDFMKSILLYDVASEEECWKVTGKGPISTKWVDVNKGTEDEQEVRCRLVARDFKPKGEKEREDLFAATPPLEAKKLLFRMAAGQVGATDKECVKLMFIDVKKAHLNGVVGDGVDVYIELPWEAGAKGRCGKLKRWLYGMRPAASAWEKDYCDRFEAAGFHRGRAAPTVMHNPETGVRVVVHGDDFTFIGREKELRKVKKLMASWYSLKVRGVLGPEASDDKKITILGRELRWCEGGIEYEADRKHATMIIEAMGLDERSKGLSCPYDKTEQPEDEGEDMDKAEASEFRALAARANFLALDRLDIQFAVKELCRSMSAPKQGNWGSLKRLARYLLERPRVIWNFTNDQGSSMTLEVYSDSDWAGCRKSRKSTSGGVIVLGGSVLKSWSSTQKTVATSSGEAEFYALTKAAAEGLGVQSVAADLGWELSLRIWVDSTAARAVASRTGLGKVRHLEVRYLWVQEALKGGRLQIKKVPGVDNPADVATKGLGEADATRLLGSVGGMAVPRTTSVRWADMNDDL